MAISYTPRDFDVLKKTIWLEARGEPHEGQVAVAYVIKNRARANRGYWGGSTIAGVCLHPRQFSAWDNRKPETTNPSGQGWEGMDSWVKGVLDGNVADPTNGALYYINPALCNPSWTKNVRAGAKIGNHQFYHDK
ncbi:hypothetical protein PMAYCL1PPCAC_03756 [Pristionchus mayeri]|uniref:Cell wall hydrolase SleB domain-containing protein n=1 Tax=Pristionchus mayeri TaxID=1317129 RepID=A0AAN5C9Y1_9BILA|nr:hypothetical protein PMAYCL1PPCAC_03756 [Pristionchus mayeri]